MQGERGTIFGQSFSQDINSTIAERLGSIKFLGVLLDEHLSWKEHIRYNENKIAKSIGLLYRAEPFLGKHSLSASFIYSHLLKLCKFSWAGTIRTNLKKLLCQQKHAIRIVTLRSVIDGGCGIAEGLKKISKTNSRERVGIVRSGKN